MAFSYEDKKVVSITGKIAVVFPTGNMVEIKCILRYSYEWDRMAARVAEGKIERVTNILSETRKRRAEDGEDEDDDDLHMRVGTFISSIKKKVEEKNKNKKRKQQQDDEEEEEEEEEEQEEEEEDDDDDEDLHNHEGAGDLPPILKSKRTSQKTEKISFTFKTFLNKLPAVVADATYHFIIAQRINHFPPSAGDLVCTKLIINTRTPIRTLAQAVRRTSTLCPYLRSDHTNKAEIDRICHKPRGVMNGINIAGAITLKSVRDFIEIKAPHLRSRTISLFKDIFMDEAYFVLIGLYDEDTLTAMSKEDRAALVQDLNTCNLIPHLFSLRKPPLSLRLLLEFSAFRLPLLHAWLKGCLPRGGSAPAPRGGSAPAARGGSAPSPPARRILTGFDTGDDFIPLKSDNNNNNGDSGPTALPQAAVVANELWLFWIENMMVQNGRCDWDMGFVPPHIANSSSQEEREAAWDYLIKAKHVTQISATTVCPRLILRYYKMLSAALLRESNVKITLFEGTFAMCIPTVAHAFQAAAAVNAEAGGEMDHNDIFPTKDERLVFTTSLASARAVQQATGWKTVNFAAFGKATPELLAAIENAKVVAIEAIHNFTLLDAFEIIRIVVDGKRALDTRNTVRVFLCGFALGTGTVGCASTMPLSWNHFLSCDAAKPLLVRGCVNPPPEDLLRAFEKTIKFDDGYGKAIDLLSIPLFDPDPQRVAEKGAAFTPQEIEQIAKKLELILRTCKRKSAVANMIIAASTPPAPIDLVDSSRILKQLVAHIRLSPDLLNCELLYRDALTSLSAGDTVLMADGAQMQIAEVFAVARGDIYTKISTADLATMHPLTVAYRFVSDIINTRRNLHTNPLRPLNLASIISNRFAASPIVILLITSPTYIMASTLKSAAALATQKLLLLLPSTMMITPPQIISPPPHTSLVGGAAPHTPLPE